MLNLQIALIVAFLGTSAIFLLCIAVALRAGQRTTDDETSKLVSEAEELNGRLK